MRPFYKAFIFFLFIVFSAVLLAGTAEEDLRSYSKAMTELAEECDANNMDLEAKITRNRLWANPQYGFFFPSFPEKPIEKLPDDAHPNQIKWFESLRNIEQEYGQMFLDRAKESAEAGEGIEAYQYAEIGIFIDPDQEELRKIFGYTLYEGEWRRAWEIKQLKRDKTDQNKSTSKKEKKKQKIRIETEHFEITSTETEERTAELSESLEEFWRVWHFLFFPMVLSEKEAVSAVLFGEKESPERKHKVVYFKNREEYLKEILRFDAGGAVSSGGYFSDKRTVYLYTPDPNNENESPLLVTAAHEVTHQLFAETASFRNSSERRKYNPGGSAQFWMTEGIATYLETFEKKRNGWSVGGLRSYRFLRAKERVNEPNGLISLKRFAEMGKEEFQNQPDLAKLYTESAGLTSFFFHGEGGKYRGPFMRALFRFYHGEESPEILEEETGISFEMLDRQFRNYLLSTPFEE